MVIRNIDEGFNLRFQIEFIRKYEKIYKRYNTSAEFFLSQEIKDLVRCAYGSETKIDIFGFGYKVNCSKIKEASVRLDTDGTVSFSTFDETMYSQVKHLIRLMDIKPEHPSPRFMRENGTFATLEEMISKFDLNLPVSIFDWTDEDIMMWKLST